MAQAQTNPFLKSPYDAVGLDDTAALLPGQQATQAAPEVPTITAAPLPTPAPQSAPAPRATTPSSDLLPPSDLRPIFEASAREFNVPVNVLMALGQQESRYDARAIGQPTQVGRAKGSMQYTDDTAKRLGINQFDPAQVIPAAAKQLRERLDKGESMADAVRGHFAGPDRSQWGPKTAAYGDEVLAKAGQIGDALYAGTPATPEAPNANARLQAQLEAEAPGRYKVLTEVEAANLRGQQDKAVENAFSPALPRDQYERMFRKMNPGATDAAIAQVMGAYDAQQKATTEAKGNAVQDRFAALQSPDALFQQRLNAKLQAKSAGGVVPKLPAAGTVTPKDLPIIDPGAADRETGFDAAANYLGHSTKSGLYDLAGAGARILDSINPFTLSPEDAAVLYKDDPAKLKALQDNSTTMILSRFANRMADNADESMANISARAKRDYGNLEYATLDPEKSALKAPTKVIGDAIRSLPTSAALAVSVFFTRGAALQAERQALAQGLSKDMARQAAIQAGAKAMATTGAASEGAVGYAQQVNQVTQELQKMPQAELAKSPQYQAMLADGYTPETARARLIAQTAEDAGKLAGIADAAVNKFGGQFLGKILTEGGKLIPRIMKGAANEAMTETTQSALEQLGQNVATQQHINPNQDLTQGVGEAAVAGGVVGGLMGGAAAGAGGRGNHATPEQQVADAIAQQTNALQANPHSIDDAARAALNPNQGAINPAETRLPAPSHAPSTAPGLLTRAVEDASVTKQPDRVTATMADGTQESGQLTGYQEDAQGNFVAQILGDDGQVHTVDSASGIALAPEAAPAAGPLTTAMDEGAAAHAAEQPQTAPQIIPENIPVVGTQAAPEPIAVPDRPVEVPLASMDLPALQERLTYIQEQAKRSGGMTRPMVDARNAVQREIKQRKQEAARAPNTAATVAGSGIDTGVGRGAVPAGRTGATESGGLVPAGVVRERGGADAIAAIPAGGEQGAANPSTATEAANTQPALTGYPTDLAARQARKELGLGKSHQVIERAPGQFDIVPQAAKVAKTKPEAKQAPRRSADKLAAAEAKAAKQEAAIAQAQANIAARQESITAVKTQGATSEKANEKTRQAKQAIPAQAGQEAATANDVLTGAPNADQIAQQESLPKERGNGGQSRKTSETGGRNRVQRQARGGQEQAQPQQVKPEPRRKKTKEPALSVTGGAAQSAIDKAMADKTDTTVQVPGIGEVTLPYGDAKSGLAHIAKRRGAAFLPRVANLLEHGKVFTKDGQEGRVFLGHGADEAVLSLTRDGAGGPWLLSAYEKYPDLHEAKRSEVAPETMPAGEYFTKDDLQANLTSKGILGQVIAAMIEKGVIVLHGGPNKLPQGIGRRVKGVQAVTLPDGTIHMVASNLTPQTALPVLLHEMFHQGGEALIGSKEWGNLQGRLGSLYRQSEASSGKAREFFDRARARVEAARAKGAVSRPMAVEEFGAYAIEEYEKDPRNLPQAIRKWVEDLIGMVKTWAVQRFGKQLGQVTPAQLAAMARLALLDHAAQRRGQIFGPIGEAFSTQAEAAPEPKFSVSAEDIGTLAKGSTAPQGLTPPEQGQLRRLQAAVQDNQNRVKQVQERIGQMTGNQDLGKADYYGAETLRPGKTAAVLEDFRETLLATLVEDIAKSGFSLEQVEDLLHAQHAEERNAAVAKINPEFDPASPEYGGTQGSGMNDAEAQQIIAAAADQPELQALAQRARDIAKATLDLKLAYGLMKPADYELLSTQYANYVPLKGDGEYGPKVKRAMGHGEREEHILSNIARDYEQATVAGEKNLARQSLLQMVLKYPDEKLWTARVPPRGKYVAGKSYSVQRNGKSEAVFSSLPQVNAFLEAKGAEAANYEVLDNAGERVVEFTKPLQNNEVLVYVNGDPVRLQFHDATLAQQLRPLNGGQLHPILEKMRAVNRYLSGIYTGYNPAFIFKNAVRDALTGTINMTANQGAGVAAKAWGNYPNALQAMGRWAATRKAPDSAMGRWLEEYRQHGGKTGASWMADLENQGKSIQATFDQARGLLETAKTGSAKRTAAVAWRNSVGKLAHVIEVGNQATENALRLALYATLREQGQSPAKAAQAAKTVTVDFDRKGSQTSALGALYLFLNPAIQGTANAFKALAKGEHRMQAWAALGGLASLGALAAGRGMDDDKDRWLGQSWEERTKNFRMKIGSHELVLPVSQEFAPFYAAGVAGAEALRGEKPMTSAARLFSSMVDAYFPLQGAFKAESDNRLADVAQAAVPTLVKPLVETAFNRNSFGSQIVPESPQTKDRADTQKMFRGTKGTPYDTAAQTIAKLGGGKYENDWSKVSPETLKYLWRTYTGGLGAFITDSAGAANIALRDPGSLDSGDVPIVKDFIKDENAKPLSNRYRNLAKEAQGAITEWRDIKKAGDGDAAELFGADQTKLQLAGMGKLIAQVNKAAAALSERKVDINADPSMSLAEKRAALKAIEAEEAELYRGAIGAFGQ